MTAIKTRFVVGILFAILLIEIIFSSGIENPGEVKAANNQKKIQEIGAQEEQEKQEDLKELPLYSTEYLAYYLDDNNIKVKFYDIIDDLEKISKEEAVFLQKRSKLFKADYYAVTKDVTDLLYAGKTKDNKPDGFGMTMEFVTADVDFDEDSGMYVIDGRESDSYYGEYCVITYAGEFKDGRMTGKGAKFKNVFLENETSLEFVEQGGIKISQKMYDECNGDLQDLIITAANPIEYVGEFENGVYEGKGAKFDYTLAEYVEMLNTDGFAQKIDSMEYENEEEQEVWEGLSDNLKQEKEITVTIGKFKKGKEDGKVKIYEWGDLYYDGKMKKGEYHGKGKLYYQQSKQLLYKGKFANGLYDGRGTEYNEDGSVAYKGKWKSGDYAD